jgi:hypothetical protein
MGMFSFLKRYDNIGVGTKDLGLSPIPNVTFRLEVLI